MIPAMIGDLRERVPPLDVPPSEGLASGGKSRHCGTSRHIDFYRRRSGTAATVRPRAKTRFMVTIYLRFWRLTLPMNLFDSPP
jgi:hypothetical protein